MHVLGSLLDETASPTPRRGARGGCTDADRLTIRLSSLDRTRLMEGADAAGLSLASYVRAVALQRPIPKSKRMPSVDAKLLALGVAALNKVGSNINQIARALNSGGEANFGDLLIALSDVRAAVAEIREAVGRKGRP